MLEHRLSCTEGSGDTIGTTLCHREEGVDEANLGDHGLLWLQTLSIAVNGTLDRPLEAHGNLCLRPLLVRQHGDCILELVVAGLLDGLDGIGAIHAEGHHNLVAKGAFRHGSQHITTTHGVAHLGHGSKAPHPLVGDGVKIDSPLQEVTGLLGQLGQGVLETVENLSQKTGSQLHRQELAGELNLVTGTDALCHLVHLKLGLSVTNTDYLTLQFLSCNVYVAYFVQGNNAVKGDAYHVSVYGYDLSLCIRHFDSPSIWSYIAR